MLSPQCFLWVPTDIPELDLSVSSAMAKVCHVLQHVSGSSWWEIMPRPVLAVLSGHVRQLPAVLWNPVGETTTANILCLLYIELGGDWNLHSSLRFSRELLVICEFWDRIWAWNDDLCFGQTCVFFCAYFSQIPGWNQSPEAEEPSTSGLCQLHMPGVCPQCLQHPWQSHHFPAHKHHR